jgi:hypothetical protein
MHAAEQIGFNLERCDLSENSCEYSVPTGDKQHTAHAHRGLVRVQLRALLLKPFTHGIPQGKKAIGSGGDGAKKQCAEQNNACLVLGYLSAETVVRQLSRLSAHLHSDQYPTAHADDGCDAPLDMLSRTCLHSEREGQPQGGPQCACRSTLLPDLHDGE